MAYTFGKGCFRSIVVRVAAMFAFAMAVVLVSRPATALADFTYSFPGGSSVTVSDDLSRITGQVAVREGAYSRDTGRNSTTFSVTMPDGQTDLGYCYEAYQGLVDHLSYPEPGEGTAPFVATRINDQNDYEFIIDTTGFTTFASWVQGSPTHVKQKVIVPSHNLTFDCGLKLEKRSSVPSITNGNNAYSLAGAIYGVYVSRANAERNRNREATLVTAAESSGVSSAGPVTGLANGKYYVRELVPSVGYALDETIYEVTLSPSGVFTLAVTAVPNVHPLPSLSKVDADMEPGHNPMQGDATLADTWLRLDYYGADQVTGVALRTWYVRLDERGEAVLSAASLVGESDPLYMTDVDGDGTPDVVMPKGTLRVSEFKAPVGYRRNTGYVDIPCSGTGRVNGRLVV